VETDKNKFSIRYKQLTLRSSKKIFLVMESLDLNDYGMFVKKLYHHIRRILNIF
jgi:hypothetical protein